MPRSDLVFLPSVHEAPSCAPCLAQIWSFFPLYTRLVPHVWLRSGLSSLCTRGSCPMSGSDLVFLPSIHEALAPCLAQIWSPHSGSVLLQVVTNWSRLKVMLKQLDDSKLAVVTSVQMKVSGCPHPPQRPSCSHGYTACDSFTTPALAACRQL